MKKIKEKYSKIAMKLKIRKELEEEEEEKEGSKEKSERQIDWGMKDDDSDADNNEKDNMDADESDESKLKDNPFAVIEAEDESFYASDPKRALKNYFDREGEELYYDVEDLGPAKFKCRIRLPITNKMGESIYAEVSYDGKKKECVAQCALEACRLLNAEGVLKQSRQEIAKRKKEKDWESADFYDSDEDTYLDRTGEVEKKRLQRMAKVGKLDEETASKLGVGSNRKVLTFDILQSDFKTLVAEQKEIEAKLEKCKDVCKAISDDDVDSYIRSLKMGNSIDTITRAKYRRRLVEIKNELVKLDKLLNVAKPVNFDVAKWKQDVEALVSLSHSEREKKSEREKEAVAKQVLIESNSTVEMPEEILVEKAVARKIEVTNTSKRAPNELESNTAGNVEDIHVSEAKTSDDSDRVVVKPKKAKVLKQTEPVVETEMEAKSDEYKLNPKEYAVWMPPEGNLTLKRPNFHFWSKQN